MKIIAHVNSAGTFLQIKALDVSPLQPDADKRRASVMQHLLGVGVYDEAKKAFYPAHTIYKITEDE